MSIQIGIIGGSGLYDMAELTDREERVVTTPFGDPSGPYVLATLRGRRVAFLARHGHGHRLLPSELNFRANIYGFKILGAEWILSASAVGSLREDFKPLDLVIPTQFYDRTRGRVSTFFGDGLVAHVGFAHPFCKPLGDVVHDAGKRAGATIHRGGTYVCMEGPLFSTKAESRIYRQLGCDLIGMTALPEAKLAREAELCYATIACVTDYDVWRESEETVTVEMVIANLQKNVANAQRIIRDVVSRLPADRSASPCGCSSALANAILTDPAAIPASARERHALLLEKYLPG
jgi:5'-methylthioadenosine phosphorylase